MLWRLPTHSFIFPPIYCHVFDVTERHGWPRRPVFLCQLHGIIDWFSVCVTWPHFALVPAVVWSRTDNLPWSHLYPVGRHHSCGPTLSGSCWGSWQWDGPSPCRCPQARVSLCPPRCYPACSCHLLSHGVFDPHPSWFLSLIWGKGGIPAAYMCL